jgi:hypothetical protein
MQCPVGILPYQLLSCVPAVCLVMPETTVNCANMGRGRNMESKMSLDFVFIASIFFVLHCVMSASSAGHFVFSHAM